MAKSTFSQTQKDQFNGQIVAEVVANGYSEDFGKLVAAQANYESGGYSNNAFIKYNNICGYKYQKGSKYQLQDAGNVSTEGDNYAHYATIEDSVDELISWFERRQKDGYFTITNIKTPKDFVNALLSDPNHQWFSSGNNPPTQSMINDYILGISNLSQKIQFIYEENSGVINGTGITLICLGLFVYLYAKYVKK